MVSRRRDWPALPEGTPYMGMRQFSDGEVDKAEGMGYDNHSTDDWKDFLLAHKWMPRKVIVDRFGVKRHDLDNFKRKPAVRSLLKPWAVSAQQPPDRLRAILTAAWEYYISVEERIDIGDSPLVWVPRLLALKNVQRSDFGFLVNSKYLKAACPERVGEARRLGLSNVAVAAFEFWPGRERLTAAGVLPLMFLQTHAAALVQLDTDALVEHVYVNFLAGEGTLGSPGRMRMAKERLVARHDEPGFVPQEALERFGVPYNFCKQGGGLRQILRRLAEKYRGELGMIEVSGTRWSMSEFRKRFPNSNMEKCVYCGLHPVDLHHLLPRDKYPSEVYEPENVVPLCVNVHAYITRARWTPEQAERYDEAVRKWRGAPPGSERQHHFSEVMSEIHQTVYPFLSVGR